MSVFPTLQRGDTIGVMAPSSRVDRQKVETAAKAVEAMGYTVKIHPQTFAQFNQSAGTTDEKLKAFHDLWRDPSVKAIMAAKGGNRAGLVLEHLDYGLIASKPKVLIGFSDVTALLSAVNKMSGIVTFHGPVLGSFASGIDNAHLSQCFRIVSGVERSIGLEGAQIMRSGKGRGRLIGGNLSILCSLMGTPYEPDFKDAILFLEDCSDELSRFDRMFLQLRNAGVLKDIKGLIIGEFTDLKDTGSIPFGFSLEDVIKDHTQDHAYPVVTSAPFGHGKKLVTFPVGMTVDLVADGEAPGIILPNPRIS